jgi:hypothetical protein
MARRTHYSPQLSRINVCALYHEAKSKGVPMQHSFVKPQSACRMRSLPILMSCIGRLFTVLQ